MTRVGYKAMTEAFFNLQRSSMIYRATQVGDCDEVPKIREAPSGKNRFSSWQRARLKCV